MFIFQNLKTQGPREPKKTKTKSETTTKKNGIEGPDLAAHPGSQHTKQARTST